MVINKQKLIHVLRYLTLIFTLSFVTFIADINKAHAQDIDLTGLTITCNAERGFFEKVIDMTDMDIRRTALNHVVSVAMDGIPYVLIGKNSSQMQQCGAYFIQDQATGETIADNCSVSTAAEECANLTEVYNPYNRFAQNPTAGTVVGLAHVMQGAAKTEPAPVSLAYWWNDNTARIPFAGKALAAPVEYNGPFLGVIFDVWRWVRNVSYGIMSLVLLITGFMIITRKKIGPQAAVTVQQAIPRIVIALILITFSYPIGAFGAKLAFTLQGNTASVVQGIFPEAADGLATAGVVITMFIAVAPAIIGSGGVYMFILLGLLLIGFVLYLLAYIQFAIIYLKILFSIIGAPFLFALGAIPGNEKTTETWFRRFIAHVISLPAIVFILDLTVQLSIRALVHMVDATVFGVFGILVLPFFIIYGFSLARKVPNMIETNIVGDTKRR